jgi:hypothetical protein
MHIFYEQAFDTLYLKHDALKASYKRKSYANLPIDEFKRLFSAFCLITYFDQRYSFTESDIKMYIKKSLEIEKITVDGEMFLNDLLESVCLIQRDGIYYSFSHRSFQEYFCAYFISRMSSVEAYKSAEWLAKRIEDSVLSMLRDMNQDLLEEHWILPRLEEISSAIEKIDPKKDMVRYMKIFGEPGIHIMSRKVLKLGWHSAKHVMYVKLSIMNLYPKHWKAFIGQGARKELESDTEVLMKFVRGKPWLEDSRYQGLIALEHGADLRRLRSRGIKLDLRAADNKWLKGSGLNRELERDKKSILDLRAEVKARVEERKKSMHDIFAKHSTRRRRNIRAG